MALLIAVLPLGCVALARLVHQRDVAAWAATVLMCACTLSTIVADVPLWNLRGGFGRESSLTFMLGCFALWALARSLRASAVRPVAAASCVGVGISALVAVAQLMSKPADGLFEMIGQRPSGLHVNPVYFGAALAGVGALSAHAWARGKVPTAVAAAVLLGSAILVGLSGSRGATLGLLLASIGAIVVAPTWRLRTGITATALGGLLLSALPIPGLEARDTLERASGGTDGRLSIWRYGVEAFLDQPWLGHGYGQFRPAVQSHFTPNFVGSKASDVSAAVWPDAHNIVIQYAVVGGVVAVAALVTFVYFVVRISAGPLAWAAMACSFTWLLQPATLALTPLVALWLGLAARRAAPARADEPSIAVDRRNGLLLIVGLLLAVSLIGLDNRLRHAIRSNDFNSFASWAEAAPSDPVLAGTAASLATSAGRYDDSLEWRLIATELEPRDAVTWSNLARQQLELGYFDEANSSIAFALEVDPYNPYALEVAQVVAVIVKDDRLATISQERACAIDPSDC